MCSGQPGRLARFDLYRPAKRRASREAVLGVLQERLGADLRVGTAGPHDPGVQQDAPSVENDAEGHDAVKKVRKNLGHLNRVQDLNRIFL